MHDLLKIFIAPGAVFSSLKQEIKPIQPLLTLLLCVVVLTGAQPLFISDQAYIERAEKQVDSALSFLKRLGERMFGEEAVEEIAREFEEAAEAEGTTIDELIDESIEETMTPEQLQFMRISEVVLSPSRL